MGLALVVTRDGAIPLLSHAYPGDRPDVTQFGSLPPSGQDHLLAIPASAYRDVDTETYPGPRCLDTQVTALGVTRRAVLTHSPTLHAAQPRALDQTLAKARRRLTELQARLARGKTRRDRAAVAADIEAITKPRWVREVINTTLVGDDPDQLRLTWHTDTRALRHR